MLRLVPEGEKAAFRAMLDAYLVEHAALVDPDGEFDPLEFPTFDLYWTEPRRRPWWIEANGVPVGLALVGAYSPSQRGTDQGLIEFYVAPEHRRSGIGLAAAVALFQASPGIWELQVDRRNPAGFAFWPKAIAAAAPRSWEPIEKVLQVIHRFDMGDLTAI